MLSCTFLPIIRPQSRTWRMLVVVLLLGILPVGRHGTCAAVETEDSPNLDNYPSAEVLGDSPLRIWTDERLRMWAYRLEEAATDPVTQQLRPAGFYKQYWSASGYVTALRVTRDGQQQVFTNADFTPVEQVKSGSNTITSRVTVDQGRLEILHTLIHNDGDLVVRHAWTITNKSAGTTYANVSLRYGGDTFFGGFDSARGYFDATTGFLYCANPDAGVTGVMGMQAGADSPATSYYEDDYASVNTALAAVQDLPHGVDATFKDNGMAVEWRLGTRVTGGELTPGGEFTVTLYEIWTESGGIQVLAPASLASEPGSQSRHTFRLQSLLNSRQTIHLQVIAPEGWLEKIPESPLAIDAGAAVDVPVDIAIPSGTAPGIFPVSLRISYDGGDTFPQAGEFLITVQDEVEPPLPIIENLPNSGSLPLSVGDRTIYAAISPSTPQGITSVRAALSGDQTLTRAFIWKADISDYVELQLPGRPSVDLQVHTGIFIATRVPLNYNLAGYPSENFSLTLLHDNWTFAGIPPVPDGDGGYHTSFVWPGSQASGAPISASYQADIDLAGAMGTPGGDIATSRPWFWNGEHYVQVDTLECGKGYWFKNNLQDEDIVLQVSNQQFMVDAIARRARADLANDDGTTAATTPVRVRDQGSPPPPPTGSRGATSSSSGGGCGSGSGVAAFALLLFMVSLRFLIARR